MAWSSAWTGSAPGASPGVGRRAPHGDAGGGLDERVEAAPIAPGADLAPGREGDVRRACGWRSARAPRVQAGRASAPGRKAVDNDVGPGQLALEPRGAAGGGQVDRHAALAQAALERSGASSGARRRRRAGRRRRARRASACRPARDDAREVQDAQAGARERAGRRAGRARRLRGPVLPGDEPDRRPGPRPGVRCRCAAQASGVPDRGGAAARRDARGLDASAAATRSRARDAPGRRRPARAAGPRGGARSCRACAPSRSAAGKKADVGSKARPDDGAVEADVALAGRGHGEMIEVERDRRPGEAARRGQLGGREQGGADRAARRSATASGDASTGRGRRPPERRGSPAPPSACQSVASTRVLRRSRPPTAPAPPPRAARGATARRRGPAAAPGVADLRAQRGRRRRGARASTRRRPRPRPASSPPRPGARPRASAAWFSVPAQRCRPMPSAMTASPTRP